MTHPKGPQADIREEINYILSRAVDNIVDGITEGDWKKGDSLDELVTLFQAHQQELLSELLGEAVEVNTIQYSYDNGDKVMAGFTNSAVPVSVINRKIGELNG